MLSIFQMACFRRQFLAIFQSFFFWFKSFIFDILVHSRFNKRFKICFKLFFESMFYSIAKNSRKELQTWYFLTVHFGLQANSLQGSSPPPSLRYRAANFFFYHGFADLLRHIRCPNLLIHTPLSLFA